MVNLLQEFSEALMDTTGSSRHIDTMSSLGATDTFGSTAPSSSTDQTYANRKQAVRIDSVRILTLKVLDPG